MSNRKGLPRPEASKGRETGCLIVAGLVFLGLVGAIFILGPGWLNTLAQRNQPAPMALENSTSPEMVKAKREEAAAQLSSYGWQDKEAGVVHIPIEQAMNLVAENGLPVGDTGLVEATLTPEVEVAEAATPETATEVAQVEPTAAPVLEETGQTPEAATPTSATEDTGEATATPEAEDTNEATPTPTPEAAEEATATPEAAPPVDLANISFQNNVLPIFVQHCSECHDGDQPEEGLRLTSYDDIMAGSFNGSVVEPGDVEGSYLVEQVVTGRMPKRGDPLTPAEIEIVTAWIEAGAPNN